MSAPITTKGPLVQFLQNLPRTPDDELVTPPGIGLMKAKFVRRGLEIGVLKVHWSGVGLEYARYPAGHVGGRDKQGQEIRCGCATCIFDHQVAETYGSPVPRAKVEALIQELKKFQFARSDADLDRLPF